MNPAPAISTFTSVGLGQIISALKIVLDATAHRGELASLELAQARDHVFATMFIGLAAVVLALLGGFAATFTLAVLVWSHPDRGLILGLVSLGYFICAGLLVFVALRRLQTWHPLGETRRQLHDDRLCLQSILTPSLDRR